MRKSDKNLSVIKNFILFLTHTSSKEDGGDINYEVPQTFTPKIMYDSADDYIEEDHVDGRDNEEDHIVTYTAESSFATEDPEQEFPECVVIVADFGDDVGTQTVSTIQGGDSLKAIQEFLKFIVNPLPQ